ncbi:SEC-C motif-containing protein [Malonomonas rubra DSM 5091]|uniref:SEC-C motif-containing protein n=1 Tax=Malonomonas rubra DSM 5091 TaxID=1122189 RepID=A0A1M6N110_MALRU|nr:SEC-C metal-binding domain-containing protein [Malonomonas rubra]SHJ89399.1 SEC-C motif-containing protein [Malonomonas rubra DSM 5091]
MKPFWKKLLTRNKQATTEDYPRSMLDLQGSDPCWCGSGKAYRKCHRPADRKRAKELGLDRSKGTISEAFR